MAQTELRVTVAPRTLGELARACGGHVLADAERRVTGVTLDSRAAQPGDLFAAVRGARDGHDFVPAALAAGAAVLIADAHAPGVGATTPAVVVADVRLALGALARWHRRELDPRVVGVTGSNGKTTTKELLAGILRAHAGDDAVLHTEGNLNNDLGVPLTLLRLQARHRYAVIELGMSGLGEIAQLAALAEPEVGVVTGIGPAHLLQLGSLENVARAKGELFGALGAAGIAVLPDDQPLLDAAAAHLPASRQRRFGASAGAAARIVRVVPAGVLGLDLELDLDGAKLVCRLPLVGPHNARNAAAAALAAHCLGVPAAAITAGLARGRTAAHRASLVTRAGRQVLDDCYNANPASTQAALETLASLRGPGTRAVAVLGDMLELGAQSPRLHAEVGAVAARVGLDLLVVVGELGREIGRGAQAAGLPAARVVAAATAGDAARAVLAATRPGDWVLIKASRGMRLEVVLDELQSHPTAEARG